MSQACSQEVVIHTFGVSQEGVLGLLSSLGQGENKPRVQVVADGDGVSVHVRGYDTDPVLGAEKTGEMADRVRQALGAIVYGQDNQTLSESLVALLREKGWSMVTAESCTGGLIGKMVTDVAGASAVYRGGWVTYSDEMKVQNLGVPGELIDRHGAVSKAVARAMVCGAVTQSGADVGVSVTGIAGPDGGTADKPVGTVWIGVGVKTDDPGALVKTDTLRCNLTGPRSSIRRQGAMYALQAVRLAVLNEKLAVLSGGSPL